jgi:hypothetical protein
VNDAYSFDLGRRLLQPRPEGFHWARSSSFVCRFSLDELPSSADDTTSAFAQFGASPDQRGHLEYPELATELGRPPAAFPFAAAVYVVNHPESTWGGGARAASARSPRVSLSGPMPPVASSPSSSLLRTSPTRSQNLCNPCALRRTSAERLPKKLQRTARSFSRQRSTPLTFGCREL